MGFGEAAIRTVPVLPGWLVGAIMLAVVLLLVAVVLIARISKTLREGFYRLETASREARAAAAPPPERLVRVGPQDASEAGDEARVRPGFEEFGPMTEIEHNIARLNGRDALKRHRAGR